MTRKGKGYAPAEQARDKGHGVAKFDVVTGEQKKAPSNAPSYTSVFAKALVRAGEADDKIIAVLENDQVYGRMRELTDVPDVLVERLRHYFGTYKMKPGEESNMSFAGKYGREDAEEVVIASMADYNQHFAHLEYR